MKKKGIIKRLKEYDVCLEFEARCIDIVFDLYKQLEVTMKTKERCILQYGGIVEVKNDR